VEALQLSFKNILQIENLTGFDSLTKLQVFLPVPSALKGNLCVSVKQPGWALPESCLSGLGHLNMIAALKSTAYLLMSSRVCLDTDADASPIIGPWVPPLTARQQHYREDGESTPPPESDLA
jgi:hypothetical protein